MRHPLTIRSTLWMALLACAAVMSSCNEEVETTDPGTETLPKVTELGPDNKPPDVAKPVLDPTTQGRLNLNARLSVERLMFRRSDWKVDVALRSLEPAKLQAGVMKSLNASGFYISQLPLNRLALFRANLPGPLLVQVSHISPMADYSPVSLVTKIRGTNLGRAVDDAGKLTPFTMRGGEYRLLARLAADDQGQTLVDLLPQHYFEKITAELRMPGQRVLDGQLFEALRIKQAIPRGQVWLIWADAPPRLKDEMNGEMGSTASEPAAQSATPAAPGDDAPLLGSLMLNGLRGQQAVRMVLVVYVTE